MGRLNRRVVNGVIGHGLTWSPVALRRMSPDEYLPHVEYEIRMLMHAARRLSDYPDYAEMAQGSIDRADHDAYLESFLIHARVIHEFFRPEKPTYKDDVRAWQICPALKGEDGERSIPPILYGDVVTRINKQLAHPTLTRVSSKDTFPIRDMAVSAVEAVSEFFEILDDPAYGQLCTDLMTFQGDETVTHGGS